MAEYIMAESRSRTLEIPSPGDPDRKRVLNVLAQRRYRQRRQERVHALERKFTTKATPMKEKFVVSTKVRDLNNQCLDSYIFPQDEISWPASNEESPNTDDSWCSLRSTVSSSPENNPNELFGLDQVFLDMTTLGSLSDFDTTELQTLESSQYTFPDDASLQVPELKVIKAGLDIATLLNCGNDLWDLGATRLFSSSSLSSPIPPDLEPTEVQALIPHHPLFDILPWPSVRNKFIYIFAQPVEMRPKVARDPMALIKLQYDLEHTSEGVRISSEDCYCGDNWEIGQIVFQNWWWALDRKVVERSNVLRARRGAPQLRLTAV